MVTSLSRALLRTSSLIVLLSSSVLLASHADATEPLDVVVTADRTDVPLKNTGSAITVISSEEIEKIGSKNIADVLRMVPGLTLSESGGVGGSTKVQLRGASPGGSMILLDGIRISDVSNTEGYFDFGNLSAANIERIEVLRGPQSALYGSDAMGGVINIITKRGKRTPVREVTLEGGSYGTFSARGSMSGATDTLSYSFGVNALHSDGFPRYGYRINRDVFPYFDPNPTPINDPTNKGGVNGTISYRINENVTVDTGLSYYSNSLQLDNPYAFSPQNVYTSFNHSNTSLVNGFVRSKFKAFDGSLQNEVTIAANQTNIENRQREGCFYTDYTPFDCHSYYQGKRLAFEYQGNFDTRKFGHLTFGGRSETEFSTTDQNPIVVDDSFVKIAAQQTTNSVFVQDRYALSDRLDVSLGGRVDAVMDGNTFPTWRSTLVYRIDETHTKLRTTVGTGAKSPSLFQRFSQYGSDGLRPETSFGYDVGFDQDIMNGVATLSATYFNTDYQDKIDWGCSIDVTAPPPGGCYYNIGRARSQGVELSADVELSPENWHAKFGYTFNDAMDLEKHQQLYHVPRHQSYASLVYTGIPKWSIEPRLTYVGDRLDTIGTPVTLPGYLRFDLDNRYKVNDSNDAYVRFENLSDAHTEDVYNYGSAGRSVYVGWTSRW